MVKPERKPRPAHFQSSASDDTEQADQMWPGQVLENSHVQTLSTARGRNASVRSLKGQLQVLKLNLVNFLRHVEYHLESFIAFSFWKEIITSLYHEIFPLLKVDCSSPKYMDEVKSN